MMTVYFVVYLGALGVSMYFLLLLLASSSDINATNEWFFTFFTAWFTDIFLLTGVSNIIKFSIFNYIVLNKV